MNKKNLILIAGAGMLVLGVPAISLAEGTAVSGPFADIPADHWAYQSVYTAQKAATGSLDADDIGIDRDTRNRLIACDVAIEADLRKIDGWIDDRGEPRQNYLLDKDVNRLVMSRSILHADKVAVDHAASGSCQADVRQLIDGVEQDLNGVRLPHPSFQLMNIGRLPSESTTFECHGRLVDCDPTRVHVVIKGGVDGTWNCVFGVDQRDPDHRYDSLTPVATNDFRHPVGNANGEVNSMLVELLDNEDNIIYESRLN